MLDKMGKTDIGEAAKALTLIMVVGIMLAVVGGLLVTMLNDDNTSVSNPSTTGPTKMIAEFHGIGKDLVGVLGFWFPILGILMIAFGGLVLYLGASHLYLVALGTATAVALVLAEGIVPLHVMGAVFAASLIADVYGTVRSGVFPQREANPVICLFYKRTGPAKAWCAYGIMYAAVFAVGYVYLADLYVVLAILASVHMAGAMLNRYHFVKSGKTETIPIATKSNQPCII